MACCEKGSENKKQKRLRDGHSHLHAFLIPFLSGSVSNQRGKLML